MRKPVLLLMLAATIGGGGLLLQKYRIAGLGQLKLEPRDAAAESDGEAVGQAAQENRIAIRIASFKLPGFGVGKLSQPRTMKVLADVAGSFEVLAVEGLEANGLDVLHAIVELVNASGRHYDFMCGSSSGRNSQSRAAFLFDTDRIEVDRSALYAVADPDGLFEHPPLVGWFRVRGVPTEQAFTFTLMAIDMTSTEQEAMAAAYRAVRDDGRGEDDVIVLGDFEADDRHLGRLAEMPYVAAAISGVPTNTQGDRQLDNVLFSRVATEFTGRAAVLDLIRQFNLTLDEALAVSDHMPVWAEFSSYEGGESNGVARREQPRR